MDKKASKMRLIIDLQIMQTPARYRGMGQYVYSFLGSIKNSKEFKKFKQIEVVFTDNLTLDKELIKQIKTLIPDVKIHKLPLVTSTEESNYKLATLKNVKILEAITRGESTKKCCYLISSLFQSEIYPAFPSQSLKALIFYDLIPLQMHEIYFSSMNTKDYLFRYSMVYEANLILSLSKTTANALQVHLGISSEKITVINGGPAKLPSAVKPKIEIPENFILMTTGNDPRKNNQNAINAFKILQNKEVYSDYRLVITSVFTEKEKQYYNSLSEGIIFTDIVSDEELAWLYKNCKLVIFPSVLEGLGMPLLEAMYFNKPVIASDIDIFREISTDIPWFVNPYDPANIAEIIDKALQKIKIDPDQKKQISDKLQEYSWDATANTTLSAIISYRHSTAYPVYKKKIAVICPYPSGISAIGKNVSETHASLINYFEVDYYFETASYDKEIRPNLLGSTVNNWDVSMFSESKYNDYDFVIYHIGNGGHHSVTASLALTMPGLVVLHDLNLKAVFDDLLKNNRIDKVRYELEEELNKKNIDQKFTTSIVNNQKAILVHSEYAKKIINKVAKSHKTTVFKANLPTTAPRYNLESPVDKKFIIGLAGILADIKGLRIIEKIANDQRFVHDQISVFGLNFADKEALDRLRQLPNVVVETNLTDYLFQEKLKSLSVFVNYRTHYQGEASSATIEAMRYEVPVIVRSDFGWYSELPEGSVIKVGDEDQVLESLIKLKANPSILKTIGEKAKKVIVENYSPDLYVHKIYEIINQLGV